MHSDNPHINIAVTGHVDHGKSTLVGRLLVENDEIPEHKLDKYKQEAVNRQRNDSAFAFLSDNQLEERDRGLSIKPSYSRLHSEKRLYTLIDCPGHRYYTSNMIRGVNQSDAAVLVVSAPDGIQELTHEHAVITHAMGSQQITVAVSKMDAVDYDQARFELVANDINELFDEVLQLEKPRDVIPVSGLEGRNVTAADDGIPWYEGPSLLEALADFELPPELDNKPLRIPIDEKHTMSGIGTTVAGTIRSGNIRNSDKILFEPSGVECTVRSIEMHHEKVANAGPRDNVGINLSGVATINVEAGNVGCDPNHPVNITKEVTGEIQVVSQPPEIKPGVQPVFHAHAMNSPCEVVSVTKEDSTSNMDKLTKGNRGKIDLQFPEPIAVDPEAATSSLNRFLLRDNNETIAVGTIEAIKNRS